MKWSDGDTTNYSPKDLYIFPEDGTICLDVWKCTCAGWDEVGHEMHCGLEYLGMMDGIDWNDNPTMLWSMAWDFTQI